MRKHAKKQIQNMTLTTDIDLVFLVETQGPQWIKNLG